MPCYHPLKAWRDADGIRFVAAKTLSNLALPCGQCFGCRLERSRQWAVRCMHEASLHRHNCFLTLTLNDEHLVNRYFTGKYDQSGNPLYSGTLLKEQHQKFLKRLRTALGRKGKMPSISYGQTLPADAGKRANAHRPAMHAQMENPRIRYYMAGEYGEQFARPHYHICIFGLDFADKAYWRTTPAGSKIYRSPTLEKLWTLGHSTIGELTFESAAYTARYVMKKINGPKADRHYEVIDHDTGEILRLLPEYNEMSRAKGIGKDWITKYQHDAYTALPGKVIIRGKEANTPRYYDKQLEKWDPNKYELIHELRAKRATKHNDDQKPSRLAVREKVARAKTRSLLRRI